MLTLGQAAVNNQASTAIANTLPGGGALAVGLSYTMFREWGFDNAAIGLHSYPQLIQVVGHDLGRAV